MFVDTNTVVAAPDNQFEAFILRRDELASRQSRDSKLHKRKALP